MMQGEDIREVQQKLGIQTDGIYGPVTEQAVKNFQQEKGLTVDGIVGPNTWTALDRVSSETALAKIGMGSIQKTITNVKGDYWDPLSTTEKIMYGGGVATIIIGAFIAANN
jgi:peptidoglycan hydrolase-like protein with peptidoglycan-binding domain